MNNPIKNTSATPTIKENKEKVDLLTKLVHGPGTGKKSKLKITNQGLLLRGPKKCPRQRKTRF